MSTDPHIWKEALAIRSAMEDYYRRKVWHGHDVMIWLFQAHFQGLDANIPQVAALLYLCSTADIDTCLDVTLLTHLSEALMTGERDWNEAIDKLWESHWFHRDQTHGVNGSGACVSRMFRGEYPRWWDGGLLKN